MLALGFVQAPPLTVTLSVQKFPILSVQVSVYAPAVETLTLPLVASPVENPPPLQVDALLELHVRVDGIEPVGDAERLQETRAGAWLAVTFVQAPQLLFSLLSAMTPAFPAELLSAQART